MAKTNNMKISVSNYGPIAEAKDIELCPLTIFVGPSNTGKSYLAILIYALLSSFSARSGLYGLHRRFLGQGSSSLSLNKGIRSLLDDLFKGGTENLKFLNLSEKLKNWASSKVANLVSEIFHQEIQRCMGISQKENGPIKDNFNLRLVDAQKLLTMSLPGETPSIEIGELDLSNEETLIYSKYMPFEGEMPSELKAIEFLSMVLENIFNLDDEAEIFYLPAARTGIMQSHRAIAGALVERASLAGIKDVSVPTLSGIVSDFLKEIIMMDATKKPDKDVAKVATDMEKNILHGSVKTTMTEGTMYPEFLYKQNGFEIPLLGSSSMVSELAPVVLFIRHKVAPGDLLIIEEPESHLHPEAQRGVAKVVVDLVRAGVKVMVTTHSEYFLEQISNYVRRSKLGGDKKPNTKRVSFLKEEEIGAYVFKQRKKGTIVKRLKFDKEGGLSPEDHNKVSSDLYNETVKILDDMDND